MYANLIDEGYACLRRSDPKTALHYLGGPLSMTRGVLKPNFAMAVAYLELAGIW